MTTRPTRDRLDELAAEGGFIVLPLDYMAEVMERPEEEPDDRDDRDRKEAVVFTYDDLSKQRTDAMPPSYIPDNFGIHWNFDTAEPAPTRGRIALNVFDLHDGSPEWEGKERFAVTAIRQATGEWWLDLVYGHGKEGGGTAAAFRLRVIRLSFEEVVAGSVEYVDGSLILGSAAGYAVRDKFDLWAPHVRALRFLQVGHEDARAVNAGKGDEPWPSGTGTITIYDLGEVADGEPEDFDASDAVHRFDELAEEIEAGAEPSVSGDPQLGMHRWVNAFDFHRFLRRGPYPAEIPDRRGRTADHEAMLAEQFIRDSVRDTEGHLRRIARMQSPKRFTEADVEAAYGGAGRGVRPPKGGVYGWPETEGATERRDEARRHFKDALLVENWPALAGFVGLPDLMKELLTEEWAWRDVLHQLAAVSDDEDGDMSSARLSFWRRVAKPS